MRNCSACHKQDSPWFDGTPCSCGLPQGDEPARPEEHTPDCKCLAHEIVLYPVRLAVADLAFDANGGAHLKSSYHLQRGWTLKRNGQRWYRVKFLCRDCIGLEDSAQERRRDYERACKSALKQDDTTYAQMLASQ